MPASSQGYLCLGGAIGRHNQPGLAQPGPSFSINLDLNAIPTPIAFVAVLPGETWYFQAWYRDSGSNNFTNGVCIAKALFTDVIVGLHPNLDLWVQAPHYDLTFRDDVPTLTKTGFGDVRAWMRWNIA